MRRWRRKRRPQNHGGVNAAHRTMALFEPLRGRNKARMARNRLVTGGMRVERVFCTHFCTYKSDEKFGVRRQAVFRATPLFKHEYGGRAVRKSGAATRAQRGSCHRTPDFASRHLPVPPRRARRHNDHAPKPYPLFTRNARSSHPPVTNRLPSGADGA